MPRKRAANASRRASSARAPALPLRSAPSIWVRLPPGTDLLLAEFVGSQSLYSLACAHQDLVKYVAFVARLEELTTPRVESLAAWLSSSPIGDVRRRLPRLTHLHFAHEAPS